MSEEKVESFSVVAVVKFNNTEAFVLNRPLRFIYERVGNNYIGSDGPFRDYLYYQRGRGSFVAFAGRELTLRMIDGSDQKIKDHWWSGIQPGYKDVIISSAQELTKCYVFCGASCLKEEFDALRSSYSGCVYPYLDYEKVVRYDDMRKDLWKRLMYQERRCANLINEVKKKHIQLKTGVM